MVKYRDNDFDDMDEFDAPKWDDSDMSEEDTNELSPNLKMIMDDGNDVDDEDIVPVSNSKLVGKHSLGYDSIFKGKRNEANEDETEELGYDGFKFDPSTIYHQESFESADYHRNKELHERVYQVVCEFTDINIQNNRRKPSRVDFNEYFKIIVDNLHSEGFSLAELFVELAYYFSENLFNMFKLLDAKYGEKIMEELTEKKNMDFLDDLEFM